jgi:F0F1-type ATP synthase assembly protein I
MPTRRDNSFFWLGKYLSLALTLPASVAAGYILGALADHWLHMPFLKAIGILLGMASGIFQIVRELTRESTRGGREP